ncbi:ATP-binding cassette sub-family C member 4-like isoform X2 [Dysidea avara]|uniref:ATP-binding cassette sub-family C member 4-like isoform X2 n=1 Tax=Dysidea avara TaxID=196820 RepID=UPI0033216E00
MVQYSPWDPPNEMVPPHNAVTKNHREITKNLLLKSWLDPLIWIGYKRELKQDDLYATPKGAQSQILVKKFNKYWNDELQRHKRGLTPRLWFAILQCLKWRLLIHGILFFIFLLPQIGQSILVGYLSQYFCEKNSLEEELSLLRASNNSELVDQKEEDIQTATRNAYLYAAGITVLTFFSVLLGIWVFYVSQMNGMMCRIVMTMSIYSKVLRLSQSTISQQSIGRLVNLCSNDVQKFDMGFDFIHEVWAVPVFIPVVIYLLWREIGPSCLPALAIFIFLPMLQYISTRLYARWRLKAAKVTDKRVRVMNEIISGMRLIKMYAWEWAFHEHVKKIRRKESRIITQASMIYGCNLALFYNAIGVLSFMIFSTYAGSGNTLTPKKVFTSLILLSFSRRYFVQFLVYCLLRTTEMSVSLKRIKNLLLLPELGGAISNPNCNPVDATNTFHINNKRTALKLVNGETKNDSAVGSLPNGSPPRIVVSNLTASWTHEKEKLVLNNISFTIDQSNRLLAVVGPVGAGKSSILQCLLRELESLDGSIDIEGSVSYASQEPWIFSGTIKENILFGEPFDKRWFNRVVECCSLAKDIDEMPFGEDTLIGERGVNLSGGQKARVNLARAVYRDSDIMLLDDPLSAVDAAVSTHLFDECICGVLSDKLVVLVTHQLQYAQHANSILVIKEGCVQGYGNYAQLTSSGLDPTELFDDIEQDITKPPDIVVDESEDTLDIGQESESGRGQDNVHLLPVERAKRRVRLGHSESNETSVDLKLEEQSLYTTPSLYSLISVHDDIESIRRRKPENAHNVVPEEERAHGTISTMTYFTYVKAGGNAILAFLLIAVFLASQGSIVTTTWWLSRWSSEGGSCSPQLKNVTFNDTSNFDLTTNQWIGIFGALLGGSVLITVFKSIFAYIICLNASRNLHNKMFKSVLRAPILFFDTNPVGRILNRFSADTGLMDSLLPNLFVHVFSLLLDVLSAVLVACAANYWLIIPAIAIVTLLVLIRHYFLHASRDVQRIESIARSPLYSHISATVQGLTTIRAYKEQNRFVNKLHFYQNEHSKGWHVKIAISRWFGLRVDTIGGLFIVVVMFASIPLADNVDPALVGLSLFYAIRLTGLLQFTIRTSADVENLLVSVERVMGYGKLESEAELLTEPKEKAPSLEWPIKGIIQFENVKFKYAPHYPYVLKSISLKIQSGEKVGVVGRTGAGKSSLLSALFRLAEPEGVFEIDGIQITEIGLHDLRKKMSIIPQDPVLFSGSVRYNLDPFKEHRDDQLWNALEEVQLKDVVSSLDKGLDAEVSEGGSNFSVGQRQLMCLARALLRKNKILVIDEATANVDLITDGIIQEMIRSKFNHCTILTIAHRLETIMDSDRILVLSSGKVIEFDTPFNLVQSPQSVFRSMVDKTGPLESDKLKKIAKQKSSNLAMYSTYL